MGADVSKDPVVAICVPIFDDPSYEFHQSMRFLQKPGGGTYPGKTHFVDCRGLSIETARRLLTEEALRDPTITHLLWVDDDMHFPPNALARLLSHNKPVVGGLCHNRRGPSYHPILARKYAPEWGLGKDVYGFCYDYPPDALFSVDATGGAFLLVERKVVEDITTKYGPGSWWNPLETMSEDFSFCHRAKECGYEVLVDTGLDIGHVAKVVINKETSAKLRTVEWQKWNAVPMMAPKSDSLRMSSAPEVSIVIPTYNQKPKYLVAAVISALGQTIQAEVIVVDDGTDQYDIDDVLGPYLDKITLFKHTENKGISTALNTGISLMTTPWFCWLSSDDLLDPLKVEMQLSALKTANYKAGYHSYGVIGSEAGYFSRYVTAIAWQNMEEQKRTLSYACPINGSTVMIHKDVFDDLGRFDTTFKYGQDWEMWARIGLKYFWYRTANVLGMRREDGNLTAMLEKDPVKAAIRDSEDARVKAMFL